MIRTKIIDALKSTDYDKEICIKGWVHTHRSSKAVDFIAVNDGSTIKNIQVVVDEGAIDAEVLKQVTTGSCVCVEGKLVKSPAQGQASEIHCEKLPYMVYVVPTIQCKRKDNLSNTCDSMPIFAYVPKDIS